MMSAEAMGPHYWKQGCLLMSRPSRAYLFETTVAKSRLARACLSLKLLLQKFGRKHPCPPYLILVNHICSSYYQFHARLQLANARLQSHAYVGWILRFVVS